jgi:hypothetical protein
MKPHTYADYHTLRPRLNEQRPLSCNARGDSRFGSPERKKQSVPLRVDLGAAILGNGGPQKLPVAFEHPGIATA